MKKKKEKKMPDLREKLMKESIEAAKKEAEEKAAKEAAEADNAEKDSSEADTDIRKTFNNDISKVPAGLWISGIEDKPYTGKAIKQDIKVYYRQKETNNN